ncbi:uncharacterized protein [Battus philenor]|uniref:uncharacterized protein n=1 Tax=Battus philenor TaxID=42288 RepID=UPI0035D10FEF
MQEEYKILQMKGLKKNKKLHVNSAAIWLGFVLLNHESKVKQPVKQLDTRTDPPSNWILQNADNYLLRFRRLFQQYCVDMLGMPAPNREMNDAFNRELERERENDHQGLDLVVQRNVPLLNYQQKEVYDTLMKAIADENGGLYFLDAPGGTGKTFLMSLVLATVRARSNIAVAVASSGIAATSLEGCRTAHSAFKLPLNLQTIEEPTCNIAKHSAMAKVLAASKIITWDECTMAHKRALEALNRTLKDLRNDSRCFGGAMILLSGDFRQILPVIPRSTAADEINACLKSSNLWRYVKKLQLTTNMRVTLLNDTSAEDFSEQLLTIGNVENVKICSEKVDLLRTKPCCS